MAAPHYLSNSDWPTKSPSTPEPTLASGSMRNDQTLDRILSRLAHTVSPGQSEIVLHHHSTGEPRPSRSTCGPCLCSVHQSCCTRSAKSSSSNHGRCNVQSSTSSPVEVAQKVVVLRPCALAVKRLHQSTWQLKNVCPFFRWIVLFRTTTRHDSTCTLFMPSLR